MNNSNFQFSLLPKGEEAALHQFMIDIMTEVDAQNKDTFTLQHWKWNYQNLPSFALVYVGKKEEKIVSYYHVPVFKTKFFNEFKNFSPIQDVAVDKDCRGQGLFRDFSTYVTENIGKNGVDVTYTYPNHRSMRTFIKYNKYKLVKNLDNYLLPINLDKVIKSKIDLKGVEKLANIPNYLLKKITNKKLENNQTITIETTLKDDIVELYKQFSKTYNIGTYRDERFLKWRYIDKPTATHKLVTLYTDGKATATTIIRHDTITNLSTVLLMDFAFTNEDDFVRLLSYLKNNSKSLFNQTIDAFFCLGIGTGFKLLPKAGFIKVPVKFSPRPLTLVFKEFKLKDERLSNAENWFISLSDWDVF